MNNGFNLLKRMIRFRHFKSNDRIDHLVLFLIYKKKLSLFQM